MAERLGAAPDDRLLILNCADLGFCHAATTGVYDALRDGLATSASLLVPAPWAREAASRFRGDDVGVRLTLNAEHDLYRWGPITQAPSLLDGDGGFPRTVTDVWDHADLDEVRRECRAQVERAVLWGFDISHLDAHMDALLLRPEFFDIYLELAVDFGLPLRLPDDAVEPNVGLPDPPAGGRGGRAVRRPGRHRPRRRRARGAARGPRHARARRDRDHPAPGGGQPPSCGPPPGTGRPGWPTTRSWSPIRRWPRPSTRPARTASATGRCATPCASPSDRDHRTRARRAGCRCGAGPKPLTVTGLLLLDPPATTPPTSTRWWSTTPASASSGDGASRPGSCPGSRWWPTPWSRGAEG